jgi:hypothetical protein
MCIRNAYVSVAVNFPAVTSRYHGTVREISQVTRNKRRLRHTHVKSKQDYTNNVGLVVEEQIHEKGDEALNSARNYFLSKMWKNL